MSHNIRKKITTAVFVVLMLFGLITAITPPANATGGTLPNATANDAANISFSGATLSGTVNANGTDSMVYFEYGRSSASYDESIAADPYNISGSTGTPVSLTLSGLSPNTKYYYRIKAVGTGGTAYSTEKSFETAYLAPTAATLSASEVKSKSATLNGTVNANNADTAVYFEYGTSASLGTTVSACTVTGVSTTNAAYTLSNLIPFTTYYCRIVAVNGGGTTYGEKTSFQTPSMLPDATVNETKNITYSGAVLHGTVNANNSETTVYFQYSTKANMSGSSTVQCDQGTAAGTSDTAVSLSVSGLTPNTIFYVRIKTVGTAGTSYSPIVHFTSACREPNVITDSAGSITSSGAVMNGRVIAYNSDTTVSFEYGTDTNYGKTVTLTAAVTGMNRTAVSYTLSDLLPNTTYHYRVKAVNSANTTNGSDMTFVTTKQSGANLTADITDNDVDHDLIIGLPADAAFASAITGVSYGGHDLTKNQYEIDTTGHAITLHPGADDNAYLRAPGTAILIVTAAGYENSSVSQTINAGAAAKMIVTTQPVPGLSTGDTFATQPVVKLYDRYNNLCSTGASASAGVTASAKAGTGTWAIGGTTTVSAASGAAIFTDLTGTLATPGTGAMTFVCGALSADSSLFAIAERNSGIQPDTAAFDKYTASTDYANITVNMTLNGNQLSGIYNGNAGLTLNGDYTVSGSAVTILKPYLAALPTGKTTMTFKFSKGSDRTLDITVSDTTPKCTVTFKNHYSDSDLTDYTTETAISGSRAAVPDAPKRSGYLFKGWYQDSACSNEWNFKSNLVTSAAILYAKWEPSAAATCSVIYNGNGSTSGSVPTDNTAYAPGAKATVRDNTGSLSKSGNTFSGWSFSGNIYTAGQTVTIPNNDVTFSAVWVAAATAYTVTYNDNYTGGGILTTQKNIISGSTLTAPSSPVKSGYTFIGWYKDAACANAWNFGSDTVTGDTTLYARWVENIYSIDGTVIDDETTPAAISGVSVKVMQGNIQLGNTVVTDSGGNFTVTGIPDGIYNLVVSKGNQEVTLCIAVGGTSYNAGSVTLPSGNRNSKLNIIGSDTPNIVVDNLNNVFNDSNVYTGTDKTTVAVGGTVEIRLTVQQNDSSPDKTKVEATMSSAGYTSGIVMDVDMSKTSTTSNGVSQESAVTATDNLIKLIIPLPAELQGKSSYVVYRAHDYGSGIVVDAITTAENDNHEYVQISGDKTQLILYVKYFSTYVIGYSETSSHSSGKHHDTVIAAETGSGTQTAGLPYYIDDNGRTVFIGFASDVDGTMKYIAPGGRTVLFMTNPKSFADISGNWGKSYIDFVTEREIFFGTGSNTFSPDEGMTRAMFATVIGRLYERSYGELTATGAGFTFTDVDYGNYYGDYIDWAVKNNIIAGTGNGKFEPDRRMTREEMAAVLYRFAEFLNVSEPASQETALAYSDASAISVWAKEAAEFCQQSGIITGRQNNCFAPQSIATRAEVAAILEKFIEATVK